MRLTTATLAGALALCASSLLAACSGGSSNAAPSTQGGLATLQSLRYDQHSAWIASGHLTRHSPAVERREHAVSIPDPLARHRALPGNLYLSNTSGLITVLKNGTYAPNGTITNGISTPDGEWTDANKNLYVANYYPAKNVVEYSCTVNACGSSPIFTYSTALNNATNVTADRGGNVYVVDFHGSSQGTINEYAQGSNTVSQTCSFSSGVFGVAVDSSTGNVFVALGDTGTHGYIEEFSGGLSGCNGTILGVTIGSPGGLTLDNNKNIIVCDQWNGAVDVIAPPYSSVTKTIGSGWIDPFEPALKKRRHKMLLYVQDSGTGQTSYGLIGVFDYPSGTHVTTISGTNSGPFKDAYGVTDTFNFVP